MAVGSERSSEESDLFSQHAPYEDELDYFKSSKGGKPLGDNDFMNMLLSQLKADGGKRTKGKRDADSSELSDDDDGGFGTGDGGGSGGNQLAPRIGQGMYDDDFGQEAPKLPQQKRNETQNPPVVESRGSAPAEKSAQQGLLIDEMPKAQAPSAGKGGILEDLENAPMSKEAPAKLKRGVGDHLKSFVKGVGSFGAWALSGFGLGGLAAKGYLNWRSSRNNAKAESIASRFKPGIGKPGGYANREEHLAQHTRMGGYLRKRDKYALQAAKAGRFASGYQWRKRAGLLTGSEKKDIYVQASREGNDAWRDPDFTDDKDNMRKPEATWRDARDVLQGRAAEPVPEPEEEKDAGGEQEPVEQQNSQRHQSVESADDQDDKSWMVMMQMQAIAAERQREKEEEEFRARIAEQSRGVTTAAQARMLSQRVSQARATQRMSQRKTSKQLMFSQLGSTKARAPQVQAPVSPISPIIEEEEKEED